MKITEENVKFIKLGSGIQSEKVAIIGNPTTKTIATLEEAYTTLIEQSNTFINNLKAKNDSLFSKYNITQERYEELTTDKSVYEESANSLNYLNIAFLIWILSSVYTILTYKPDLNFDLKVILTITFTLSLGIPLLTYNCIIDIPELTVLTLLFLLVAPIAFSLFIIPAYIFMLFKHCKDYLKYNKNSKILNGLNNELSELEQSKENKPKYIDLITHNSYSLIDSTDSASAIISININGENKLFECDDITFKRLKNKWFGKVVPIVII